MEAEINVIAQDLANVDADQKVHRWDRVIVAKKMAARAEAKAHAIAGKRISAAARKKRANKKYARPKNRAL